MTRSSLARLLCLALGVTACGSRPDRGSADHAPAVNSEAESLGRELFQLVDRASDYQSSHRGKLPATIAQLGIDSLTHTTVRRLVEGETPPAVQVAYRHAGGHGLTECHADSRILEEAALNEGRFSVTCSGPGKAPDTYKVGGS